MGSKQQLLSQAKNFICTGIRNLTTSTSMEIRFDGKRALVTGAGKGIGKAVTLKLAEAGAKVIAVSRTQSDLDALKKQYPNKIEPLCLDISKWDLTCKALKGIGQVDLLVNNAGIMDVKEFGDLSEAEVNRTFDLNVKALINITQVIANGMKSRGQGGAIVNLSSILGLFAVPSYGVYCGSKGAVHQLTRTMATEYGPYKIRVNSVNPTAVRTELAVSKGWFDPSNEAAQALLKRMPLGRPCEPEDVVGPILFLLSDQASMITGVALPIDGGLSVCYT